MEKQMNVDETTNNKQEEKVNSQEEEQTASQEESQEEISAEEKEKEEDPIATLEKQVAEYKDKYIRQVAEFDNYRKRVMKEKAELIKNGGEKVISAILPIVDDFERAHDNMEKMEDVNAVKEGVALIIDKFLSVLKHEGLEKIDAVGQPFDVDFHEAIAMVPGQPDEMKGKVLDCVQTGYKLNDKVIRHAKVAVAQ